LGIAFEATGDSQSALAEYRRAPELKPGYADVQSNDGQLLKPRSKPSGCY